MLEFEQARAQILASVARLDAERVPLEEADGRVLAEAAVARQKLPTFDASAMDGYAVALDYLTGAGPWLLPVRGESRTGHPSGPLEPGSARRIFTGAELPSGAEAVVLQED